MSERLGRNDSCTTCGKKVKHCQGHKKAWLKPLLAITTLSIIITIVWTSIYQKPSEQEQLQELKATLQENLRGRLLDKWWLKNDAEPPLNQDMMGSIFTHKNDALQIISKYHNTSELSNSIARSFIDLSPTVWTPQGSMMTYKDEHPSMITSHENTLELCYIPYVHIQSHPATLYYSHEWRALILAGLEYPEPVLAGLLYHELGHAYIHQILKASSANTPEGSDAYNQEEVEMHDFESQIYDRASEGKFFKCIDTILARYPKAVSYKEVVSHLTPFDIQQLDLALGCEKCGSTLANTMLAQYCFAIGSRWIDKNTSDNEPKTRQKIAMYDWLFQNLYKG
jgi:hypothetical protein